jgi:hypothetical protein
MLASVSRLRRQVLTNLKLRLGERTNEAVKNVKEVALRISVVAALAVAAAIFALLALIIGVVALYAWLEPAYGVLQALGITGGALAIIALLLIGAATLVGRRTTARPKTNEIPPSPLPLSARPAPADSSSSSVSGAAAGDMIEPFVSLVRHYAHTARTGSAPVDDFIRQMESRVELETKKAVTRAATLVQTGDRATMLAVLCAAATVGWLLVKTTNLSAVSTR